MNYTSAITMAKSTSSLRLSDKKNGEVVGSRRSHSLAIMISVAFITASTLSPVFIFRSSTASRDMRAVMTEGVFTSTFTLAMMSPLSTDLTMPFSRFRALIFKVAATQYSLSSKTSPM